MNIKIKLKTNLILFRLLGVLEVHRLAFGFLLRFLLPLLFPLFGVVVLYFLLLPSVLYWCLYVLAVVVGVVIVVVLLVLILLPISALNLSHLDEINTNPWHFLNFFHLF